MRLRVYARVCVCVCLCTFIYLGCLPFFFSHYRSPGITLHERDAFSNRWWPMAALFSLSHPSARLFSPGFFFPLFFTGAPIIHHSAFASVSYSFSTDRGRPLSPTALASTLFHLIKGHKLPARPPYDSGDGGKKKRKGKKEDILSTNCSSRFFPRGFPRRRTLSGMKS